MAKYMYPAIFDPNEFRRRSVRGVRLYDWPLLPRANLSNLPVVLVLTFFVTCRLPGFRLFQVFGEVEN